MAAISIYLKRGYIYKGLDMEAGPNVDLVPKNAYIWEEIENDAYDVVISGQALEHIEFFWITIEEMVRVTKENGLICIIAPNGFEEHRYPVDCWRFFTDGMIAIARFYELEIIHASTNAAPKGTNDNWYSNDCADSMLIAKKSYAGEAKRISLRNYKCIPMDHDGISGEMISYKKYKEDKDMNEVIARKEGSRSKNKEREEMKTRTKIMRRLVEKTKKIIGYFSNNNKN